MVSLDLMGRLMDRHFDIRKYARQSTVEFRECPIKVNTLNVKIQVSVDFANLNVSLCTLCENLNNQARLTIVGSP